MLVADRMLVKRFRPCWSNQNITFANAFCFAQLRRFAFAEHALKVLLLSLKQARLRYISQSNTGTTNLSVLLYVYDVISV